MNPSRIVHIIPRQLAGIGERLLQHLLRELVIVFELERLVVEADGLVELSAEVVDEPNGEVGLRVGGVEADALLEVADGALVLPELAAGVGQVGEDGLHHPEGGVRVAERQRLQVVLLGLLVVLQFVVDHP